MLRPMRASTQMNPMVSVEHFAVDRQWVELGLLVQEGHDAGEEVIGHLVDVAGDVSGMARVGESLSRPSRLPDSG